MTKFRTSIVTGLTTSGPQVQNMCLYICDHSIFMSASKILLSDLNTSVGEAYPFLYIGHDYYYLWHLQEPSYSAQFTKNSHYELKRKVWFLVHESATYYVNSFLQQHLNSCMVSTMFERHEESENRHISSCFSLCEKVSVQMVSQDPMELKVICPTEHSYEMTIPSILMNALKFVYEIRIALPKPLMEEQSKHDVNVKITKCIQNLYQLINAHTSHPTYECSPFTSSLVVKECWSIQRVNNNIQAPSSTGVLLSPYLHSSEAQQVKLFKANDCMQIDDAVTDNSLLKTEAIDVTDNEIKLEDVEISTEATNKEVVSNCNIMTGKIQKSLFSETSRPVTTHSKYNARLHTQSVLLVECPMCGMTYRSSKNRLSSVISHINRRHHNHRDVLMRAVCKKYQSSFPQGKWSRGKAGLRFSC